MLFSTRCSMCLGSARCRLHGDADAHRQRRRVVGRIHWDEWQFCGVPARLAVLLGISCSCDSPWKPAAAPQTRRFAAGVQSIFDDELMTASLGPPGTSKPLSAMTIGSIADLGYQTNVAVADAYSISSAITASLRELYAAAANQPLCDTRSGGRICVSLFGLAWPDASRGCIDRAGWWGRRIHVTNE